jgi:hypothetical protein
LIKEDIATGQEVEAPVGIPEQESEFCEQRRDETAKIEDTLYELTVH